MNYQEAKPTFDIQIFKKLGFLEGKYRSIQD
jgi:hypothetical protein